MSQPSLFDGERKPPREERGEVTLHHLQLERPLVVFDLETTGVDVASDRIVQIALIRVEPGGARRTFSTLVNPERPIPPAATAIHGIADADVAGQPTFAEIVADVERLLTGADLAGYNSIGFDQPLLQGELHRAGSAIDLGAARHVDAMVIFKRKERRDLGAAYRFYCERDLVDAHSALADTEATLAILDAQVGRYPDLPRDVAGLHEFSAEFRREFLDATRRFKWDADGEVVVNFGKVRGKRLRDVAASAVDRGFLEWILGKDFTDEVKEIVRRALAGDFPRQPVVRAAAAADGNDDPDG